VLLQNSTFYLELFKKLLIGVNLPLKKNMLIRTILSLIYSELFFLWGVGTG